MPDSSLYDRDFYAWTQAQAAALRRMAERRVNTELDLDHLAEEVEDLGREQIHALASDLARVIEHLLKLAHSPARDPRNGWRRSVREHRQRIARRVGTSATLANRLTALFPAAWIDGRDLAAAAMADEDGIDPATVPTACPWTLERVLDPDWYPPDPGAAA